MNATGEADFAQAMGCSGINMDYILRHRGSPRMAVLSQIKPFFDRCCAEMDIQSFSDWRNFVATLCDLIKNCVAEKHLYDVLRVLLRAFHWLEASDEELPGLMADLSAETMDCLSQEILPRLVDPLSERDSGRLSLQICDLRFPVRERGIASPEEVEKAAAMRWRQFLRSYGDEPPELTEIIELRP